MQAGTVVGGRYAIARLLGEGGMGAVYEARHATTGRRLALKVIAKDLAAKPEVTARFELEARAAGAIESEHVAQVLDVDHDDALGVAYLVMEFLEGRDLDATLEEHGVLPPEAVLRIGREACLGLQKAHAQGILHRDIKPANLFLCERDQGQLRVKLLDFGIAKVFGESLEDAPSPKLTRTGTIVGSPLYMPPEQARGSKDLGVTADVWSLGVTLFHAITGDTPLAPTDTIGALLVTLCTVPPPPVRSRAPWVSEPVAAVIDRALRMKPEERWPSAREMGDAIAALLPDATPLTRDQLRPAAPRTAVGALTQVGASTVAAEPVGDLTSAEVSRAAPTHETPAPMQPPVAPETPRVEVRAAPPIDALGAADGGSGFARVGPTAADPAGPTKLSGAERPAAPTLVRGATVLDVPAVAGTGSTLAAPRPRPAATPWTGLALAAVGVVLLGGAGAFVASRSGTGDEGLGTAPSASSSRTDAAAPRASSADVASTRPAAPSDALTPLVGRWRSATAGGRDYDAVLVGESVEFRVVDAAQFRSEGYARGEPRFILRPAKEGEGRFLVEDRVRPGADSGFVGGASPTSCLLAVQRVEDAPLTAELSKDELTVNLSALTPPPDLFEARADGAVVACRGLDRALPRLTKQQSRLTRR